MAGASPPVPINWLLSESVRSSGLGWRPRYSSVSWVCRLICLNCRIFSYKDRPILDTDAHISMRAKVSMPSTVTVINQQPWWLTVSPLASPEPSRSEADAQALHLDELGRSLDLVWECTFFVRVLLVGKERPVSTCFPAFLVGSKERGVSACSPAFPLICALLVGAPWCLFEPSLTDVWFVAFVFGSPPRLLERPSLILKSWKGVSFLQPGGFPGRNAWKHPPATAFTYWRSIPVVTYRFSQIINSN